MEQEEIDELELKKQRFVENMEVLPILQANKPDDLKALKTPCKPVTEFDDDLFQMGVSMGHTMATNGGVGIAGNQVGFMKRVIVVRYDNTALPMVNPKIIKRANPKRTVEGCLSVPKNLYSLKRPSTITVEFQDLNGEKYKRKMKGDLAYCVQHEIDHLNGIIITRGKIAGTKTAKSNNAVNPSQSNSSVGSGRARDSEEGQNSRIITPKSSPLSAGISMANANSQRGEGETK